MDARLSAETSWQPVWDSPSRDNPLLRAKRHAAANAWTRYALPLALGLPESGLRLADATEAQLTEGLAQAIETGLDYFNMTTDDLPGVAQTFRYTRTPRSRLLENSVDNLLVRKGSAAPLGVFPFATITIGDKQVGATIKKVEELLGQLRSGKAPLTKRVPFSRKFHPLTKEGNEGDDNVKAPSGTFLEYAASVVTSLTPYKAAVYAEWKPQKRERHALIPDFDEDDPLGLERTATFIALFRRFLADTVAIEPMLIAERRVFAPPMASQGNGKVRRAPKIAAAYLRPQGSEVSYPTLPYEFGASPTLSLVVTLGKWQEYLGSRPLSETQSIAAPLEGRTLRLLVISDHTRKLETYGDAATQLAADGTLEQVFWGLTRASREMGLDKVKRVVFLRAAERLLRELSEDAFVRYQRFSPFMDVRAMPLLERYFMQTQKLPKELVDAVANLAMFCRLGIAQAVRDQALRGRSSGALTARDRERIRHDAQREVLRLSGATQNAQSPTEVVQRVGEFQQRVLSRPLPRGGEVFGAVIGGEMTVTQFKQAFVAFLSCEPTDEAQAAFYKRQGRQNGSGAGESAVPVSALDSAFASMGA